MLIPRYWSRAEGEVIGPSGHRVPVACWRGSRHSPEDAESLARQAAARFAARMGEGAEFPAHYPYANRPLREEIVEEFPPGADEPHAAITRNAYGALVLNTARAAFVDMDLAAAPSTGGILDQLAAWLFGLKKAEAPNPALGALARLAEWMGQKQEWGVRVYRTRAGLRYLVTHAAIAAGGDESEEAMRFLGADPKYRHLCRVQQCFRARLTPKPWRIGIAVPPVRFPHALPEQEGAIREWRTRYERASAAYATCSFVETAGSEEVHPEIAPIVELHDRHTRATSGLPLA
jgi:hypothetical protein